MKRSLFVLGMAVTLFVFAGMASADSKTANMEVNATIIATCTVSTSDVNFGNVTGEDITNSPGNITVNCPLNMPYNIAMGAGQHLAGERYVSDGTYSVLYRLMKDDYLGPQWGDSDYDNTYMWGTSLSDTGTGSSQDHTVYGRLMDFGGIPAGTTMSDTVTVTVYY
jgi:spore coat protein U-like protein